MKRVITAIILLSISVIFSFVSNYLISKKIDDISASMNELIELSKSKPSVDLKQQTEKISNEWKNSEWIFHAFVTSEYVAEAERSIEMLSYLSMQGLEDEFKSTCTQAYNDIHTIKETELVTFKNIF